MSVKKYRFVSPGVFVKEIDNSQLPAEPINSGPATLSKNSYRSLVLRPPVELAMLAPATFGEKATIKLQPPMACTPHRHILRIVLL